MGKCKSKDNLETTDDLVAEIENARNVVKEEIKSIDEHSKEANNGDDSNKKRYELLKLAEDGDIDRSVAYIKKASQKVIDNVYSEYERKRLQKVNEFLTDLLNSKLSSTLGV